MSDIQQTLDSIARSEIDSEVAQLCKLTAQVGDRRSHRRTVSSVAPERNVSSAGDISRLTTLHFEEDLLYSRLEESCTQKMTHFRLCPLKYRI